MQTVGIVLNVGRDQANAFERGFGEMEEPIWADLHARGELVMATLSRLDISTAGRDGAVQYLVVAIFATDQGHQDRKSTRLNSSHLVISYAVFCLKKKKKEQ